MTKHVFKSYPQKFPKTRRKAAEMLLSFHELSKKGPRTLVGTIVDTTFHISQGYVTCTTELGVIPVYGIPYGTVTNQMRVFCRQMGGHASNRSFVFDGYAPNISRLGSTSGSFVYSTLITSSLSSGLALSTSGAAGASSSITTSTGYYWHCFFYLPQLPTSTCTLFEMLATSGGNSVTLQYLPTGYLQFISQDGHGFQSSSPVAPHSMHYVQIQPGLTSSELLVDTVASYTTLTSTPTFSGGTHTYTVSLLSNTDGTQLCPIGSWISKFGYGTSWSGSAVIALSNTIPAQDSDLPSTNSYYFLLCGDSIGTSTLLNTAVHGGGSGNASITTAASSILTTGPY